MRSRVQRIAPYPEELRALTGELGAAEGEPVDAIVWNRASVLAETDELVFVDATIAYPIQLRSIFMALAAAGGGLSLCAIAAYGVMRKGA